MMKTFEQNETRLLTKTLRRERKIRKPKIKVSGRKVKNLARLIRERGKANHKKNKFIR